MKLPHFLLFVFIVAASGMCNKTSAQNINDIVGVWLVGSKDAHIKIFKVGNEFVGEIVWVKDPIDPKTGKPQLDVKNPEPDLRTRPVIGMRLMNGLEYDDGEWVDGSIYDANTGKTYSCQIEKVDDKTIELTGYIGFSWIGRSDTWKRVD